MSRVIGIDLGTTNSCVASVVAGIPTVVANRGGYKTTPSIVAVAKSGRRLVGHIAKRQATTNAEYTIHAAKRLIGRKWDDPRTEAAKEELPYEIVQGDVGDVRVQIRERVYTIPEISAMVLSEMKKVAEDHFGESVDQAVITIPAYFNDGQRQATRDAGRLAGLDVIRMINEPTAAALAYGYRKELQKKVAIFDLGGGTFDISILDIGDGVFEVLATGGDTFLGGEDFDRRVVEWLVFSFAQEHNIDLRDDPMSLQRLRDASEKAKIELSITEKTEINLPFIISTGKNDSLHLLQELTRAKLDELTADLIERTLEMCARTLEAAKIDKEELEDVILVGGQTRMPRVQRAVKEFFGVEPSKNVHPDEVVALGAAVQAHSLVTQGDGQPDLLLLDVTPHNLGIMIAGGYFQTLIPANTTVPCQKMHSFTTVRDSQTAVKIVVLQGDSSLADENELLGEFILTGLRDARRGEVEVNVEFEISPDGIVSVSARDVETGQAQSIQVTATNRLSDDELERIIAENEQYAVAEKGVEQFNRKRTEAERYLREIEKLRPAVHELLGESDFGADAMTKAERLVERAQTAIKMEDGDALSAVVEPLERTAQMFKSVAAKLNK